MAEDNQFPGNTPENVENTPNIKDVFNIGGIKIPQGNTLAIWFLVVTVIAIAFLGFGFWSVIDRILDSKLGPNHERVENNMQKDYNNLLEKKEELEQVNKLLIDSLSNYKESVKRETDSVVDAETKPYINQLYKNRK